MTRWMKWKHKNPDNEVKISLLPEGSIRKHYQEHLNEILKDSPIRDNVIEQCEDIKNVIQKAVLEALGKKQ